MGSADILKGVGLRRANALAVNLDVGDSIALIRSDGEGLISALTDADIAGGRNGAASPGSCLDGVVRLTGGSGRFDHEHEGSAGDIVIVVVSRLGSDDTHRADPDGSQNAGIGINGRFAGAVRSVNAVGHSACAVAAAGGQRQLFTIDYGSVAGDGQRLLIVLFCQGDVQRDGEILIIVTGRLESDGDLVARLAAGNRVGQQTAVRFEIMPGKCDIRAGADAVFAVIAPRLSAGKP